MRSRSPAATETIWSSNRFTIVVPPWLRIGQTTPALESIRQHDRCQGCRATHVGEKATHSADAIGPLAQHGAGPRPLTDENRHHDRTVEDVARERGTLSRTRPGFPGSRAPCSSRRRYVSRRLRRRPRRQWQVNAVVKSPSSSSNPAPLRWATGVPGRTRGDPTEQLHHGSRALVPRTATVTIALRDRIGNGSLTSARTAPNSRSMHAPRPALDPVSDEQQRPIASTRRRGRRPRGPSTLSTSGAVRPVVALNHVPR